MHIFDLNLRHLRALAATVRCKRISGAAAMVNLSQPAVTQAIAKIEALTGTSLFERLPGGMEATEAGRLLAARAESAGTALALGFQAIRRPGAEKGTTMTQLRALTALAGAGSYVGAARATGLSQPSLHRAIRDLERLCTVALAVRRGRGVGLSEHGLRLVRAFRLALSELGAGIAELAALAGRESGTVRIGAMPLARARLLPLVTARFHASSPAATVEIVEGGHDGLIEQLRDGALDLLIGALRNPEPGPDVVQELLFEDRLIVVAGGHHPLRAVARPSLEQLAACPWVMAREGTPLRQQWRAMFARAGLEPPAAPVTCGSVQIIRSLLAEGPFLTLLSPEQVRLEIAAGLLIALGEPIEATRRPIGITTRKDWRPAPAQAAFLEIVRASAGEANLQEIQ